jgi:predicted DNA-binding transcriptional regulator YafY
VVAAELARRYAVSEDSIRRDLRELAARACASASTAAPCCRRPRNAAARAPDPRPRRQGRAGRPRLRAAATRPGVLLDAGSTNLAIAQQLPAALGLTVITNAPQIATAASLLEGTAADRRAPGQRWRAVGAEALAQVQRLRADVYLPGPARWTATPACGRWMRKKPR